MKKLLGWTATMVLAGTALTGCGNSTDDYCSSLEDAKDSFAAFDGDDAGQFEQAFDDLRGLADDAPDAVSDDWDVMVEGFDALEQAVEDAGLSFADLDTLDPANLPEGVTEESLTQLGEDLQVLEEDRFQEAGDNISAHAEDECGIDLNATESESGGESGS